MKSKNPLGRGVNHTFFCEAHDWSKEASHAIGVKRRQASLPD
jgi:hypothetical protein